MSKLFVCRSQLRYFSVLFSLVVLLLNQACGGDAGNSSQSAFTSETVSCECIPSAGKSRCESLDGTMSFSNGPVQLDKESLTTFTEAFGNQLQCQLPGSVNQNVASQYLCSCQATSCELNVTGKPIRYFAKGSKSSETVVNASEKDLFLSKQSKGFQCVALVENSSPSASQSTVTVNPLGPYAGSTSLPSTTDAVAQQVQNESKAAGLSSCSSIAASAKTSQSVLKVETCAEGTKLGGTDSKAPWHGKSSAQLVQIREDIVERDSKFIGGKTYGKPYACQCQKSEGCGQGHGHMVSMFLDEYGAFFFENSYWGRNGYCKVY